MLVLMSVLLAVEQPDSIPGMLASYGAAAPLVGMMYVVMRKRDADSERRVSEANARADKAEARSEELTERLITQQAQVIPVLVEATSVIRATGR